MVCPSEHGPNPFLEIAQPHPGPAANATKNAKRAQPNAKRSRPLLAGDTEHASAK